MRCVLESLTLISLLTRESRPSSKLLLSSMSGNEDEMSTCIYCGSQQYGNGCQSNNFGPHEHSGDSDTCVYCGSQQYGTGCQYHDFGAHKHGSDGSKCIWCGSTMFGSGCQYNNFGPHVH